MKYSVNIEINSPIKKVVELFADQNNYFKWMEGLDSLETISGEPGKEGTKTKFRFKMSKKEMEMIETVKKNDLPDEYTVSYEANGVFNVVKNRFSSLTAEKTKYSTDQEFHFKGFMKLMAWLMPGAFKKQSMKYLNDFKNFVEAESK